jgi:BMFP domain-containing protein YqiC
MNERPRFFDDLAGVAGGAFSALAGIRDEAEAMARSHTDELIRKFDLVRRSELDVVRELASNARAGQEGAETRVAALEARIAALEARLARVEAGRTADKGGSAGNGTG